MELDKFCFSGGTITRMELKELISHFVYRIEPKPEGGFIARPSDPRAPALEASTREELQQKIRANIAAALSEQFPGLKLPLQNQQLNISFHVEGKPDGTFDVHSTDPTSASIQSATGGEIESHVAEKILTLVGKHMPADFARGLGAQLASGNVKVFVNKGNKSLSVNVGAFGDPNTLGTQIAGLNSAPTPNGGVITSSSPNINASNDSPIKPSGESSGNMVRFLIATAVVVAAMYAYLHFHH